MRVKGSVSECRGVLSYIANGFSSKKSYKVLSVIRALKAIQKRIKT